MNDKDQYPAGTLFPAEEARVWRYLVKHRGASAAEVAAACRVDRYMVEALIAKIGTPEEIWRGALDPIPASESSALDTQIGGSHYRDMPVQPWQALEAWLTPEEYRGYHKGVAIAYLARERDKGGDEDIAKAHHHLQRLRETTNDQD